MIDCTGPVGPRARILRVAPRAVAPVRQPGATGTNGLTEGSGRIASAATPLACGCIAPLPTATGYELSCLTIVGVGSAGVNSR